MNYEIYTEKNYDYNNDIISLIVYKCDINFLQKIVYIIMNLWV